MVYQPKLAGSENLWRANVGADVQDRTGDLVLTKDALCQLSYIGDAFMNLVVSSFGHLVIDWPIEQSNDQMTR